MTKKSVPPASEPNQNEATVSTPEAPPQEPSAPDPFDPASLRLGQDFGSAVGVKKVLTVVPVRKPNRHEFVRTRPEEAWRLETAGFEDRINRGEIYLVDPALRAELSTEIFPVALFTSITKQGDVFLWPVKLPGPDGRSNAWNDSAIAAARRAEDRWVRVASNTAAGCYDLYEASAELAEPEWPELTLHELLKLAFKDRFIRDIDHPVLRALRGEV